MDYVSKLDAREDAKPPFSSLTDLVFLGHWAHQESGKYYNGLTHEEISGPNRNLRNGIQGESKRSPG